VFASKWYKISMSRVLCNRPRGYRTR